MATRRQLWRRRFVLALATAGCAALLRSEAAYAQIGPPSPNSARPLVIVAPVDPLPGTVRSSLESAIVAELERLVEASAVYALTSWDELVAPLTGERREDAERIGPNCGTVSQLALLSEVPFVICGMLTAVDQDGYRMSVVVRSPRGSPLASDRQTSVSGETAGALAREVFAQLP